MRSAPKVPRCKPASDTRRGGGEARETQLGHRGTNRAGVRHFAHAYWRGFGELGSDQREYWLRCVWEQLCLSGTAQYMGIPTDEVMGRIEATARQFEAVRGEGGARDQTAGAVPAGRAFTMVVAGTIGVRARGTA